MKNKENKIFKYVVLCAVLIIPFMYSFFYLKAYWDPYGKGNIDNIPVAIVNNDEGEKGNELVQELIDSKKLKLDITNEEKATDGLNNKDYYAVISIPNDFSSSMESINTNNKKHPTITYSPNQKSNYLGSQIINSVVNAVEAKLDNKINSEIVGSLSENLNKVPTSLDEIKNGLSTMSNGIGQLDNGGNKLYDGANLLDKNYNKFNNGLNDIKLGANKLNESMNGLNNGINTLSNSLEDIDTLNQSIPVLVGSVNALTNGSNNYTNGFNTYTDKINDTLDYTSAVANYIVNMYDNNNLQKDALYEQSLYMITNHIETGNTTPINYLKASGNTLKNSNNQINSGINTLNNSIASLNTVPDKLNALKAGVNQIKDGSNKITEGTNTLNNGINTLYSNSLLIQNGLGTLSSGSKDLSTGIKTLQNGVNNSRLDLANNIDKTKTDLTKLNDIKEYSKEPVKINRKEVNKVATYGTSFAPLFISVGLWVGCLMMYIVLYYDKEERFKLFSIKNKNYLQRTLCYHALATVTGITLGILLQVFLDFNITSIPLYYFSMILVANTFLSIIEFLIVNFKDIGKFIALILLVLQLAASGGTFPIETVTKGFRFLNPILPMTYTINLWKESLMVKETNLLTSNLLVIAIIFIVMTIINITIDIIRQKKNK